MQSPKITTSSETLLEDYGRPHLAKLKADRQAADVAAAFEAAMRALELAHDGRAAAETGVEAAEEAAVAAERGVDGELRSLSALLFSAVGRKSSAMPYVHVFPQGGGASVEPRGRAQVAEARRVVSQVASLPEQHRSKLPPEAASIVARLSEATTVLETKCNALDDALRSLTTATASELLERRRFREQYRRGESMLLLAFDGDQRRVDGFFPRFAPSKKKGKGTNPSPTPAPA